MLRPKNIRAKTIYTNHLTDSYFSIIVFLSIIILLFLSSDVFFNSFSAESPLSPNPKSWQFPLASETFNSSRMNT